MSKEITLDDYKQWKKRPGVDIGRIFLYAIPFIAIILVSVVGCSFILTAPPQAASAEDTSIGTITLINGYLDGPTDYLVYVDDVKVGQGTLGVAENITLSVNAPSKDYHYISISSGQSAITILYNGQDEFPDGFTFMLAPDMDYKEMV